MFFEKIHSKILDWTQAKEVVDKWKELGNQVVFTNGCFDLLHFGHIHYLAQARDLGDRLVVALNSDSSVQHLKGLHRPIKKEKTRAHVLAAFACVDIVVIFEEDTPLDLIKLLLPDVLVKGGDWQTHQIVGADVVLDNGGTVKSLGFIEGFSTTNIEKKIKGEDD